MCELVDTEASYVNKIDDLVHNLAEDFRQKAKTKDVFSSSPSEDALASLLPLSLDRILDVNTRFLVAIRRVLDETEDAAIEDIKSATNEVSSAAQARDPSRSDATGTLAFAKCLLEWFPSFGDCYADYIQAHSGFGQLLKDFTKETSSSFLKTTQENGEQRLTSMLIEPVQRLPRYNLYIDNIIKQLPVRHPALRTLLKARDIISDICSRDSPSSQQSKVIDRLQSLITGWPADFRPQCRLISATDVVEVAPPYHSAQSRQGSGILLLFADCLVMVQKCTKDAMSARGILAEIDNPSFANTGPGERPRTPQNLACLLSNRLSDSLFSEYDHGKMLQATLLQELPPTNGETHLETAPLNGTILRVFQLIGAYEGKASRWVEESVKARVEARFSEAERESGKWEVRSIHNQTDGLGYVAAVFEESEAQRVEGRREPAQVRIVVDPSKGARVIPVGNQGVEIAASLV
ncbi:hypothetical protein LTR16_005638, partial [Cryomyces antarcticus]